MYDFIIFIQFTSNHVVTNNIAVSIVLLYFNRSSAVGADPVISFYLNDYLSDFFLMFYSSSITINI